LAFTLLFVVSTVTPTNVIYTLSLHDALPIWNGKGRHQAGEKSACRPATAVLRLVHGISLIVFVMCPPGSTSRRCPSDGYPREVADRKSTRLNSSHVKSSYAGFCLKKKTPKQG